MIFMRIERFWVKKKFRKKFLVVNFLSLGGGALPRGKKKEILEIAQNMIFLRIERFWVEIKKKRTKVTILGFWAVFSGLVLASDTIFRKSDKYLHGYLSRVPKKPYIAKFEQTHDAQIWGKYVTKITILGFWAVFRGLVRASDTIFRKSEK